MLRLFSRHTHYNHRVSVVAMSPTAWLTMGNTEGTMQVFTRTISSVFGQEKRYVIPLFQRPYVWNKEPQWAPLWDDIVDRAEQVLVPNQGDISPHFLGAIVIQQRKSYGDQLLAHDVIDGQQRLTTFQILLAAFRDIATARGEKQVASWLYTLTTNANAIMDVDVEQFKVWPTGQDVGQFRLVINAGGRTPIEAEHPPTIKRGRVLPRPRMIEAYIYFYVTIEKWLQASGDSEFANRCRALRRVLDRQLQLVSIELDGHEDPQVIFETLNARGVPLLAADLLRNNIFQRAGSSSEQERLHAKYWTRFEIPDKPGAEDGLRFWEMEERLSRARIDLFLLNYLAMKKKQEVGISRIYPEYKSWIEKEPRFADVEAELKELADYADHFYKLLRPERSTPLGRFASHLRVLDTSTIYPLVLGLQGNTELPVNEKLGIFRDLESFLIRRLVCSRVSKDYRRLFIQLLRDFDAKKVYTCAAFRALLAAGTGEAYDWPSDVDFHKAWMQLDAYTALKPAQVALILRSLEVAQRSPKNEALDAEEDLSIEHIMPQSWTTHWPLPTTVDPHYATERRNELLHDFGNITLITQALNSTLSNGPAASKLRAIAKNSTLLLNGYFQGRTTWEEADIQERSEALFEIAKRVWPRP